MIKWLFFDLGSTLVDESDCYQARYREITEGNGITAEDFERKVIEYARQNLKGDHEAATFYGFPLPKWRKELEKLYPDATGVLSALHERGYRLGIIANQSAGSVQRLRVWGILPFFEDVLVSAEEGIAKPQREIFERALSRAGCMPEEAVMIGDRIDSDILPAKKLGMGTVWIKQGFGMYASPVSEEERADHIISHLRELIVFFYFFLQLQEVAIPKYGGFFVQYCNLRLVFAQFIFVVDITNKDCPNSSNLRQSLFFMVTYVKSCSNLHNL